MGDITLKARRYYSGVEADMASIPAGGRDAGDQFFATNTKFLYYWDGAAWVFSTPGFGRFVPRLVTGWDKTQVDFTIDGNYHVDGLDLSAIVSAGAIAVLLMVSVKDDAAGTSLIFRANATTKSNNIIQTFTQAANVWVPYLFGNLYIDADRLVDYNIAAGMDFVKMSVMGWYI